jgi:acetyltransferase-like isoleucine patch superfamily enzyme
MTFATRAAAKFLRSMSAPLDNLRERIKLSTCEVGEGARLYGSCKILNFQSRPAAIRIGASSHIRGELMVFGHGGAISVGTCSFIGEDSRIWSAHSITIGNRVLVSHSVNIHDNNAHSLSAASRASHFQQILNNGHPSNLEDVPAAPVVIEDDVWIGFNSTILKGVTIGKGSVIGAASVVLDDVPPFTVVAGNPAKVIGVSVA